jgi:hypothetical protein
MRPEATQLSTQMTKLRQRAMPVVLAASGATLILSSPFLVVSSPLLRRFIYDEGWRDLMPAGCVWVSELNESLALGSMSALMLMGTAAIFLGVWQFQSARWYKEASSRSPAGAEG